MIHRPVFSGLSKKEILRKWLETRTQLKIREKAAKKKCLKLQKTRRTLAQDHLKKDKRKNHSSEFKCKEMRGYSKLPYSTVCFIYNITHNTNH